MSPEASTSAAAAFAAGLPATGSLLALDVSKRRIGLAGTDPERRLVTALSTFERRGLAADTAHLSAVVRERGVVALVLGLPLNMDGSEGPRARSAKDTAQNLARALDLPHFLQDERLTTEAVRQAIAEGRLARPKPGAAIDHFAAAVILEDALRALRAAGTIC
ncbi:MAG: Holliday junction resolvase RuvX [Geminicoccaceae bacterium]